MRRYLRGCLAVLAIVYVQPSTAAPTPAALDDKQGGQVVASINGRTVPFPSLKTEVTGDVQGDLASITVRQTFVNPTNVPMNARYLFPLNKDAAVHAMQMRIGDELISAKIAKRAKARTTYEKAKAKGKSAALLEQHRPNMFTQEIANLMPGAPVVITLKYSQVVPRIDNAYELRVPLVVGPRYIPQREATAPKTVAHDDEPAPQKPKTTTSGGWQFGPVPAYPPVAGLRLPTTVLKDRVSLKLKLASGIPVRDISSGSHKLSMTGDEGEKTISLVGGKTLDNRDFVLRYTLAGEQPQAGLLAHKSGGEGTFSLLIEPPKVPQDADITRREMVFVLDTSGSMSGQPMAASRTFMRHALKTLRPGDAFRIIRFSNNASEFSPAALPATPQNVAAGTAYVNAITAGGGTEILSGLKRAYARPPATNVLRIVVFLSDGYVGNEAEILKLVAGSVGKGRLYSFGVGAAVNRYLVSEMARLGRGISRIIDPTMNSQEEAVKFATRLDMPVLTDIKINWGSLAPKEVTPSILPDLFAGDSLRVLGRFSKTGSHQIDITGHVNGRRVKLPLKLDLSAAADGTSNTIPLIWARSRIADHMRETMIPKRIRPSGVTDAEIEQRVTKLGLAHSLVTRWTSFVAVSEKVVNPNPAISQDADVPVPVVKGVSQKAYPDGNIPMRKAQTAKPTEFAMKQPVAAPFSGPVFSGGSTPEPEHLIALLVLILSVGGTLVHQARRQFS
ncbi:MAG: VIT and VWA domain-containing protein [Pseudomonadota bacterium]